MPNIRPIDSFRKYFLDVKPYHTKILEIIERYNLQEDLKVNIEENIFFNIDYKNNPLCRPVGWGIIWDGECGFDATDCCDQFDCLGGYGVIYDNSDMVAEYPVVSTDDTLDTILVNGNRTYDTRLQIDSIPTTTNLSVQGDVEALFDNHNLFLIVPLRTIPILSNTTEAVILDGDFYDALSVDVEFRVYNTPASDGIYRVGKRTYNDSTHKTTVEVVPEFEGDLLIEDDMAGGTLEVKIANRNNGAHIIEEVHFDGISTLIQLHDDTPMTFTNTTEGDTHGTIQLRTALVAGRHINIEESLTALDKEYLIIKSEYDRDNDQTTVYVATDFSENITSGFIRMYGYLSGGGFDGYAECGTPSHSTVKVGFSEKLVITVNSVDPTPANTPTNTPTPTVTPTVTVSPTPSSPPAGYGNDMALVIETTGPAETVKIYSHQGQGRTFNAVIDWGDGTPTSAVTTDTYAEATRSHEYADAGEHIVRISGVFPDIFFNGNAYAPTVKEVIQLGSTGLVSLLGAFYGCSNMTTACVTGAVNDTSAVTTMYQTFTSCTSLTSIDITGWDTSNVIDMSWMFNSCTALTSIDATGFVTATTEILHAMFNTCDLLASINMTGWDTSGVWDMFSVFGSSPALTTLDVSGWTTASATTMGGLFSNCTSLTSIGDVSGWDTSNVATMSVMFNGCPISDVAVDAWNMEGITFTSGFELYAFLSAATLPTVRYDAILIAWAAQTLAVNMDIDFGSSTYTLGGAAEAARNTLAALPWTIADGGGI